MKYHGSMKQTEQNMHAVIKQLQLWKIPPTPINYGVAYHYVTKKPIKLSKVIDSHIADEHKLDNFFIEDMYRQYVIEQQPFRTELVDDMDNILTEMHSTGKHSINNSNVFVNQLTENIVQLQSKKTSSIIKAIQDIHNSTIQFKHEQQQLLEELRASQKITKQLKTELDDIKKTIYLDPLTNLYNIKAMNKYLDMWSIEDPKQKVAVIMINLDQYQQINESFGSMLSDALLCKVAGKINSYIGESGLAVRSAGDEFLVLLPNLERNIAGEIAEKIRQGIEKLKFVSSKSGGSLPQLTLSLCVMDYHIKTKNNIIIEKTRALFKSLTGKLRNQVYIGTAS